jgi:hypothetical protein
MQALAASIEAHRASVRAAAQQAIVSGGTDASTIAATAAHDASRATAPHQPLSSFPDTLEGYVAQVHA